jgi:phospholipid transport system substrate-binding protein
MACGMQPRGRMIQGDMKRSSAVPLVLLGLLLLIGAPTEASAGAPTDQLRASVDQIIKILDDPALKPEGKAAERRAAIRKEAVVVFDFTETAKRALGRHWQGLSEQDRQEFTALFTDLIERAYISKIERYSGEKIAYTGEAVDSGLATVRTRFVTKQGTEVPIDYRMQQKGDRWLVYDVSIEGVSLINNYRTQFDKIIQTSSYAELVRKLKAADVPAPPTPRS